jgi:hypothetical protein
VCRAYDLRAAGHKRNAVHLQYGRHCPDHVTVQFCPDCDAALESPDVPCAECDATALVSTDFPPVHEYAKSFENRYFARPRPDRFAAQMNAWLAEQPRLLHVGLMVHLHVQTIVRSATLMCVEGFSPYQLRFKIFRLPLTHGIFSRRQPVDEAFNTWSEEHPAFRRASHVVVSTAGTAVEVWVVGAQLVGPTVAMHELPAAGPSSW